MSNTIEREIDDIGVMTLRMNRPKVLNSLNSELVGDLIAALTDAATDDDVRAIVLTGNGRGFCAGADLDDLMAGSNAEEMKAIYDGFLRIAHTPAPHHRRRQRRSRRCRHEHGARVRSRSRRP